MTHEEKEILRDKLEKNLDEIVAPRVRIICQAIADSMTDLFKEAYIEGLRDGYAKAGLIIDEVKNPLRS